MKGKFTGPLEIYVWPWWDIPWQRARGPSHKLTPKQVASLIHNTEDWIAWTERWPTEYAIEAHDCHDLIERCRDGGWLTPFDGDMPQPNSDDSYNRFLAHNQNMWMQLSWEEFRAQGKSIDMRPERLQTEWEIAERERRRAKQAEADRLWKLEQQQRTEAAAKQAEAEARAAQYMAEAAEAHRLWRLEQIEKAERKHAADARRAAQRRAEYDELERRRQTPGTDEYFEQQARIFWRDLGPQFISFLMQKFVVIEVIEECVMPIGHQEITFPIGTICVPEEVATRLIGASCAAPGRHRGSAIRPAGRRAAP